MERLPRDEDQHQPQDDGADDSHAHEPQATGDAFAHWGSGLVLAFTMGCLFLNDLWITILWGNDKPLGTWGLALPPLLGVLVPIALVARRAGVPVREQLWLYGLSARQLFAVLLVSLGVVPVCYAAGALNAVWAPPDPEYFEIFQMLAPTSISSALGGFLAAVVCVPLGEEALFRFLLLGLLARHVHAVTAVVATGVLFAAAHLAPFLLLPIGVLGIDRSGAADHLVTHAHRSVDRSRRVQFLRVHRAECDG